MPIFMEILQTVIKTNLHEVGKTWFLEMSCIGQRKYGVSAAAGVHPVFQFHYLSEWKIEHKIINILATIFNLQAFCSTGHDLHIYVYMASLLLE